MYCPLCAVQNLDDAKFCRACGADIRLVPQAVRGTLPPDALANTETDDRAARRKKKQRPPPTVEEGLKSLFTGVALFIIFLIGLFVFRGAFWLTIWFIIPALANVGEGIGQLIRARQEGARLTGTTGEGSYLPPATFAPIAQPELSSPDTKEIIPTHISVTDATTRHLDARSNRP
ncbi:MAG TPA: zinc-ribbon domain-containing protein [Pyrinomonadaceae bacterium]|nr:zinc-ribbon domain-containing protein [Pyrinomonadaceae bacterium]